MAKTGKKTSTVESINPVRCGGPTSEFVAYRRGKVGFERRNLGDNNVRFDQFIGEFILAGRRKKASVEFLHCQAE